MGPSSGDLSMNERTQNFITEQVVRIDRVMEENQALADATYKRLMNDQERPAKGSWAERLPNWFIATGLVSGLVSLVIAATQIVLDFGHSFAACR